MRILIVEDEVIIAEDLADIVRSKGFAAECANTFDEAVLAIKKFEPDVLFCDIDLSDGSGRDGIEFVKLIREEHPLIVVVYISALVTDSIIQKAQSTRPYTYLVKPFNAKQVGVTASIIADTIKSKSRHISKLSSLTETEQKVLQYVAKGFTSKEISEQLYISEKTVRNHRYNILKKLNLSNENNSLTKWAITNLELSN